MIAHGAGSDADFLARAFPADRVGVRETIPVDDRTGRIPQIMSALARAARDPAPTILGGVSLGAHAAATLLARSDLPEHVLGGLLVMPAWTGAPDRVAAMTATAADALSVLGMDGVLAELDPTDWVTPALASAWSKRDGAALVDELHAAASSPAPDAEALTLVRVPCGLVALADDPLHPVTAAQRWTELIPHAELVTLPRNAPAGELAAFGDAAGRALTRVTA